jgi:hypothetical protein
MQILLHSFDEAAGYAEEAVLGTEQLKRRVEWRWTVSFMQEILSLFSY